MEVQVELRKRNSHAELGSGCDQAPTPVSPASPAPPTTKPTPASSSFPLYTRLIAAFLLLLISASGYVYFLNGTPDVPLLLSTSDEAFAGFNATLNPKVHNSRPPKTFYYDWSITAATTRPDSVAKRVYLINAQFPGPTLEGRPGDRFVIHVKNALDGEGLAMHWHGLHMRGQNEHDGAIGITQCPIAPGSTYTYEIDIAEDRHGTFWYHAHEQVQRADGVYGAFIIHQPAEGELQEQEYDEERVLLIGDWYHRSADEVIKWYMRAASFGNEPVPDSILINGFGAYNCSLAVPARPVDCIPPPTNEIPGIHLDPAKRYRFRVVNVGSLAGVTISMDDAALKPLTVDGGHPIEAGYARAIGVLHPGERVDLILSFAPDIRTRNAALHITLDADSFKYLNPALARLQTFLIPLTSSNTAPRGRDVLAVSDFIDIQKVSSSPFSDAGPWAEEPDRNMVVYTTTLKLARLSNIPHGFMNHTSFKPQSNPARPLITLPRSKWDSNQLVPFIPSNDSPPMWVDLTINNIDDGGHPFHLHGHDVYVLSVYGAPLDQRISYGSHNPFDLATPPPGGPYNLINPIKKDTVFIPRRGYAVLRFLTDNPGIWMLHCHLLWHQASGMAMALHIGDNHENICHDEDCERRRRDAERLCEGNI